MAASCDIGAHSPNFRVCLSDLLNLLQIADEEASSNYPGMENDLIIPFFVMPCSAFRLCPRGFEQPTEQNHTKHSTTCFLVKPPSRSHIHHSRRRTPCWRATWSQEESKNPSFIIDERQYRRDIWQVNNDIMLKWCHKEGIEGVWKCITVMKEDGVLTYHNVKFAIELILDKDFPEDSDDTDAEVYMGNDGCSSDIDLDFQPHLPAEYISSDSRVAQSLALIDYVLKNDTSFWLPENVYSLIIQTALDDENMYANELERVRSMIGQFASHSASSTNIDNSENIFSYERLMHEVQKPPGTADLKFIEQSIQESLSKGVRVRYALINQYLKQLLTPDINASSYSGNGGKKPIAPPSARNKACQYLASVLQYPSVSADINWFNTVLAAMQAPDDLRLVDSLISLMQTNQIPMVPFTYNILIRFYSKSKKCDKAESLFQQARESRKCSTVTYNSIMDMYVNQASVSGTSTTSSPKRKPSSNYGSDTSKVMDIFQMMTRDGFEPDEYTFTILIKSLGKSSNASRALELYRELKDSHDIVDSRFFETTISVCLRCYDPMNADKVLGEMEQAGFSFYDPPKMWFWLLETYVSRDMMEAARDTIRRMIDRNVGISQSSKNRLAKECKNRGGISVYLVVSDLDKLAIRS